jgi:hypothetical protein
VPQDIGRRIVFGKKLFQYGRCMVFPRTPSQPMATLSWLKAGMLDRNRFLSLA